MIPTVEELNAHGEPCTTCLICLHHVPVGMGISLITEHRISRHMTVACRGSGYVAEQHDGRDAVRVAAIKARHDLMKDIAEKRAEMLSDLTTRNWTVAVAMDFHGEPLIRMETQAHIWHELALHGELATSLSEALNRLTRGTTSTLHFADVDRCVVAGTRDWLTKARTMLLDLLSEQPAVATDLMNSWLMLG